MTFHLTGVWLLLMTCTVLVFCEMEFLERTQGDSTEFYCISEFSASKPIGFYLKRKWLQPNREVLFMYTEQNPVFYPDVKERIHVTGDPSTHRVNVTLSQLKGTDTDLYYCEFVFPDSSSLDQKIPSKMELFLYVVDAERLHLGTGLGGLAYNLTLLKMQPEESAFYSCELLLPGRPDNSARLGRHVYFVSVQDVRCSCAGYAPLLYALSATVGLLLIFVMALGVAHYGKTRGDRVKPQPHQVSIYEEMVGVRPPNRNGKVSPSYHPRPPFHLEEKDASAYDTPPLRSRQENHYERPEGVPLVSETVGEM
uniref:Immunoglobulin V-set domain-containing protein n=1 Tax=Oncorhynchus tshawytscha TaxID=74940 RepID=A0AAZ3SC87_ONCTS